MLHAPEPWQRQQCASAADLAVLRMRRRPFWKYSLEVALIERAAALMEGGCPHRLGTSNPKTPATSGSKRLLDVLVCAPARWPAVLLVYGYPSAFWMTLAESDPKDLGGRGHRCRPSGRSCARRAWTRSESAPSTITRCAIGVEVRVANR